MITQTGFGQSSFYQMSLSNSSNVPNFTELALQKIQTRTHFEKNINRITA